MSPQMPSLTAVRAVFDTLDPPNAPMTTTEVAAEFDCPTQTISDRLQTLVDEGVLETKPVGTHQHVWWRSRLDDSAVGSADCPTAVHVENASLQRILSERGINPLLDVLDDTDIGIFVLDSSFDIAWNNTPVKRFFGLPRESILGRDKRTLITDQIRHVVADSSTFVDTVLATYDDNTFIEKFECRVTAGEERKARWLEHHSRPIESGPYAGGRVEVYYDITERKEYEQELRHQHEQLVELNNLNQVIQNITDAVINKSTREEIEQIVCNRLSEADSYEFAWIGDVDRHSQAIRPRAEAGVDGYLNETALSANPDELGGQGPAGTAIRTGEIQVTQDALANPDFEPWHEYAKRYGYRSMAAIPIVYDSTFYGLLGVYADRPKAFDGAVREVIAQLGEIVGHAIAATEHKQALMSPTITEIQCLVRNVLTYLDVDAPADGTMTFDRTVPIDDNTFLEFGTADEAAIETLQTLVDRLSQFEDVTILNRDADTVRFKLRLSESSIVAVIASHGGYIQQMRFTDGDMHITVHLPPSVSVRQVIDAIQETYSTVNMVAKRQVIRSDDTARVHGTITEALTERQRSALETAVYSGFFEWPRDASGEEVADSLGVSPPTFHQHLRKAQKTIFETVLSSENLS